MCVHTCVYTHMTLCMNVYVCEYVGRIYVCGCVQVCMYESVCAFMCMNIFVCVCLCAGDLCTCLCV